MTFPLCTIRFATASLATVFFAGCGDRDVPSLQLGKPCTVQFRRDALGAGASLPVPPLTDSINGADVGLAGTLKRASAGWVVIESNGREISIPKGVILLIRQ